MIKSLSSNFLDSLINSKGDGNFNYVSPYECSPIFDKAFNSGANYIILKGGRASGKTTKAVSKAIDNSFLNYYKNASILVFRELKGSLRGIIEKTKQLIRKAGNEIYFKFFTNKIVNLITGCEFHFSGARSAGGTLLLSELSKLKGSIPDVKMVIFEEAQDASEEVLNVLFPTFNRDDDIKIKGKEREEFDDVIWIFCMNPNARIDPVIKKVQARENHFILHVNLFDLEPEFQDKKALIDAEADLGTYYYDHVWLGAPFYLFAGYPFANIETIESDKKYKSYAFLDPSFTGGDFTALNFIAEENGDLVTWGYCWREGWETVAPVIKDLLIEHGASEFYYESNNIATAPMTVFARLGIEANPRYSLGNKHNRIYQASYETKGRVTLITNKSNNDFIQNFTDYNKNAPHDDAADAFTSNLLCQGILSNKKVGDY